MKKWNALRTAVAICLLLCLALMPAALGEGINTGDFDEVYDMLDTWFEDEPAAEEDAKGPAPKPAAALASALRALRSYESKAEENPPSELDRQALGEIAETAEGLLGGR